MKWSLTHMASSSVSSVQVLAGCSGVPLWSMQAAGEQKTKQGRKLRLRYGSTRVYPSKRLQTNIHTEIKGPLVALDKAKDFVVEVEAGVPDEGPVAEDPQHHPAPCCVSDSPAETEAETESNSQSQSEPWCYPQDENLPKMNPKHQNDPMLAEHPPNPTVTPHYAVAASLSDPTKRIPIAAITWMRRSRRYGAAGKNDAPTGTGGQEGSGIFVFSSACPVPSPRFPRLGLAASPALFADLPAWGFREDKEGGRTGGRGAAFISRQAPAYAYAHGLSRSRRSEREDDLDEDQDGGRRTVWPVAGGHRHVMPPACVAATPLLPRPVVFHGISQENEALVFFSRGGARK